MRLKHPTKPGQKVEFETVTWSDHRYDCAKCQAVDIEKTATYVSACAQGSALLSEEAIKRQRPEQERKEKEVREWAKKTGVFKL